MLASLTTASLASSFPMTGHEPGSTPCSQNCCAPQAVGHGGRELMFMVVQKAVPITSPEADAKRFQKEIMLPQYSSVA
jgi:hypothetical protein